jgi:hypothetical protein
MKPPCRYENSGRILARQVKFLVWQPLFTELSFVQANFYLLCRSVSGLLCSRCTLVIPS